MDFSSKLLLGMMVPTAAELVAIALRKPKLDQLGEHVSAQFALIPTEMIARRKQPEEPLKLRQS